MLLTQINFADTSIHACGKKVDAFDEAVGRAEVPELCLREQLVTCAAHLNYNPCNSYLKYSGFH